MCPTHSCTRYYFVFTAWYLTIDFRFIDKYNQVSRILQPIVICIRRLDDIYLQPDIKVLLVSLLSLSLGCRLINQVYIDEAFGSLHRCKKTILADFFRYAFDGSGFFVALPSFFLLRFQLNYSFRCRQLLRGWLVYRRSPDVSLELVPAVGQEKSDLQRVFADWFCRL